MLWFPSAHSITCIIAGDMHAVATGTNI